MVRRHPPSPLVVWGIAARGGSQTTTCGEEESPKGEGKKAGEGMEGWKGREAADAVADAMAGAVADALGEAIADAVAHAVTGTGEGAVAAVPAMRIGAGKKKGTTADKRIAMTTPTVVLQ